MKLERLKTDPQPVKELRDEFAMAALTGLLVNGYVQAEEEAYRSADAMLKARSNNKNK